jgi:hypothetical protein
MSEDGGATAIGGQGGDAGGGDAGSGGSPDGGTSGRAGGSGRGGTSGENGTGGSGDAGSGQSGAGGMDAGEGGGGGAAGTPAAGEGGLGGEGGSSGEPGCHDPPSTNLCTDDLSGIGTGDFEVKFTIRASGQATSYAIMGQRDVCNHGYFWSVRALAGYLYVELDDNNQNYVACWPYDYLVDDKVHRVVIRRVSGVLSTMLDCGPVTTCAAPTNLSTTLPPLRNTTNDPCIGVDTFPLFGSVTDRCVRPL